MRKTYLSGAIALSLGTASLTAQAVMINVTSMTFGSDFAASGTISTVSTNDVITGIDDFFGQPWTVTTTATYEGLGSHTYAGTSPQGAFSYNFSLTEGQFAWGALFDWSISSNPPVVIIMDCGEAQYGDACTGIGVPMQTGPFPGQAPAWNGYVVPVPAAIWLFGSGLLGLVGVARRKKA